MGVIWRGRCGGRETREEAAATARQEMVAACHGQFCKANKVIGMKNFVPIQKMFYGKFHYDTARFPNPDPGNQLHLLPAIPP